MAFRKTLQLIAAAILLSGCAVGRDPVSREVYYLGWGNFEYTRSYPVALGEGEWGTHTVHLSRQIDTKEVILELGGMATAIGGALALLIPLFM